jgi:hypothetical protein
LSQWEPKQLAEHEIGKIDREAVQELMQRIIDLLSQYDGEAIDLLAESDRLLAAALGHAAHQRIAQNAYTYNFDEARIALKVGAEQAGYDVLDVIFPNAGNTGTAST